MAGLTVDKFTENEVVKKCLKDLQEEFPEGKNPLVVSDVLDNAGHQYVNLVQKGGGVLGVALVGYTYILEKMNIRFIRLAGTSAGAINTALMVAAGTKQDAKSEYVLDAICKLKFIDFVDGHPFARWVISKFITHQDFGVKVKRFFSAIIFTLVILLAGDFIFLGLQNAISWISIFTKVFFGLTGLCLLFIAVLIAYVSTLLKRLKNSGFGINPGDFFYDWIKEKLHENNVITVSDLMSKASAPVPGLHLRVANSEELKGLDGDVTFICSELVSQNKIQFPEMWKLFRKNMDDLQPAGFIRASMSIPVFFESYFIEDIPCTDEEIKQIWLDKFGETDPPSSARFVDGGILSNFPINLFYNPKVDTPRLPSFGIDLDDSVPDDAGKNSKMWSMTGYFGRIFNTIRFYYDKDFLIKNKIFKKGIGTIPLQGYNWLNFFLSDKDKIDMFNKGAQAATEFLMQFNWQEYKTDRIEMKLKIIEEQLHSGNAENQ
ncbi:patatin-like phospholipase family protein [Daejeonella oryzae]|uniref:patatin-like phospholipase family protein n=1 Tax=Daejeonella oryzae TaxID=1122943 RepID=UPI000412633C|nr:patatin-like phospholipase family protein [Daejeonella oryzae]